MQHEKNRRGVLQRSYFILTTTRKKIFTKLIQWQERYLCRHLVSDMCVETHCCNCPVVSTAYWVDRGVDCPVHHPPPHPSPGPPFIFPLPPPPGCLELSGKQPIKSNETRLRRDRWYRGKTAQVLPCSRKTFCLAETRMILNSGRSQLTTKDVLL